MELEHMLFLERSLLNKCWKPRSSDTMAALRIQQEYDVPSLVAECLVGRGITGRDVPSFLAPKVRDFLPDPSHLKDMDRAVQRTLNALERGEKIGVFGDYDVDGATSSALLKRFFTQIGVDLSVYIPDRLKEGYGPTPKALRLLWEQGIRLVITVDCGTSAHEALEEAQRLGLDVIVLDHHGGEVKPPPAVALVNPNRVDEESPYTYLAGVGVTFLFLVALQRCLRTHPSFQGQKLPNLLHFLDLVALGTVCDVVPLKGLNRALVSQGLKILATRENVGLRTLMDQCHLQEKPTPYHLGFLLGPRLNAGGRVGDASLGVDLLTTSTESRARDIGRLLETYNQERQALERQALEEAHQKIAQMGSLPPFLMVGDSRWHSGVIGIVAGRLKDHYHRPTFVLSYDDQGIGKGSGRSVPGLDLGRLVQKAKHLGLLIAGGGHAMAAGVTLDHNKLSALQDFMTEEIEALGGIKPPELAYDSVLSLSALQTDLIESLEPLGPFGQGNPAPKVVIKEVKALKAKVVGHNHVRCFLSSPLGGSVEAIAFRALETPLGKALLEGQGRLMHVYGSLKNNEWNGGIKPQVLLEDVVFVKEAGSFLAPEDKTASGDSAQQAHG